MKIISAVITLREPGNVKLRFVVAATTLFVIQKSAPSESQSQITIRKLIERVTSSETSAPTALVINGNPAVQYVVSGTIDNLKITYLHTTVETAKSFNQILAWTLRSRFDQNRAELQNVIQSFKEVPQSPSGK